MIDLPLSTQVNKEISKEKIFKRTRLNGTLKETYNEQILKIIWSNKLSKDTYSAFSKGKHESELEVFNVQTSTALLDKRLIRQIDRSIPYFVFHLVNYQDKYQVWLANKTASFTRVKITNYVRTKWLSDNELDFSFDGKSVDETYHSLIEQVSAKKRIVSKAQVEECDAFMHYFRTTKMSRSYKPILVLATIFNGGKITVEKAAEIFTNFFKDRLNKGLVVEQGNCIYADENASQSQIFNNLITNPIAALCGCGFFSFDKETKVFSFANDIYDVLTLDEIDELTAICRKRLENYFERITKK